MVAKIFILIICLFPLISYGDDYREPVRAPLPHVAKIAHVETTVLRGTSHRKCIKVLVDIIPPISPHEDFTVYWLFPKEVRKYMEESSAFVLLEHGQQTRHFVGETSFGDNYVGTKKEYISKDNPKGEFSSNDPIQIKGGGVIIERDENKNKVEYSFKEKNYEPSDWQENKALNYMIGAETIIVLKRTWSAAVIEITFLPREWYTGEYPNSVRHEYKNEDIDWPKMVQELKTMKFKITDKYNWPTTKLFTDPKQEDDLREFFK